MFQRFRYFRALILLVGIPGFFTRCETDSLCDPIDATCRPALAGLFYAVRDTTTPRSVLISMAPSGTTSYLISVDFRNAKHISVTTQDGPSNHEITATARNVAYVADDSTVGALLVNSDGSYTNLGAVNPGASLGLGVVASELSGTPYYAPHSSGSVYVLAVRNGVLSQIQNFNAGTTLTGAAVIPGGKYLFLNDSIGPSIRVMSLNSDGTIAGQVATLSISVSPYIAADPLGRFIYVHNSGGSTMDVYALNSETGVLSGPVSSTPGVSGNVLIRPHPAGKLVYIVTAGSTIQYASVSSGGLVTVNGSHQFSTQSGCSWCPYSALTFDTTGNFIFLAAASPQGIFSGSVDLNSGVLKELFQTSVGAIPGTVGFLSY